MAFKGGKYFWLSFFSVFFMLFFVLDYFRFEKEEKVAYDGTTLVVSPNIVWNKTSAKTSHKNWKITTESVDEKSNPGNYVTKIINNGMFEYRDIESRTKVPWQYDKRFKNPCWFEGDELKCLPYFFIVGITKCGTTSLFSCIAKHPEFVFLGKKEVQFFGWHTRARGIDATRDISKYINIFTEGSRQINWYQENKNDAHGVNPLIISDASPDYLSINTRWREMPGNAGLDEPRYVILDYIKRLLPKAKILVSFRDPVDRLYSLYLFTYKRSAIKFHNTKASPEEFHAVVEEKISQFKACIDIHSVRSCVYSPEIFSRAYLAEGIYHVYYEELLRLFPRNQIHLVQMEDLGLRQTVEGVFDFLEMSPASEGVFSNISLAGVRNERIDILQDVGPMLNKTRKILYQFYRPYNERMAVLTGDKRFLYPNNINNGGTKDSYFP